MSFGGFANTDWIASVSVGDAIVQPAVPLGRSVWGVGL
jgi:hypothetical protein